MRKKKLALIGLAVLAAAAYLWAAHHYMYYMIGKAQLWATDTRHVYHFNEQLEGGKTLTYAAIGDSLTSGVGADVYEHSYPFQVAEKLAGSDTRVVHLNFSYPGARTADVVRDLLDKAIADQPDVVTLLIGTNDVHGDISQRTFTRNYDFILKELSQKTRAKINVVSIPLIGSDTLLHFPYDLHYRSKAMRFNQVIGKLAANYQANYIDLATPTMPLLKQDGPHYSADKFHPANLGYKLWAEIIYDHLNY